MNIGAIKILLVEDDPDDADLVGWTLRKARANDFEIAHVHRLADALELLDCSSFDVVLLDLSLPDNRGLDALSQIQGCAPDLPIVVLTGLDDEPTALQALQCGAQDYLVKSGTDQRLLARSLRYAVERQRVENALCASEKRFRALIEHSSDAFALLSPEGLVTYASPSTARILGYSLDEFIGSIAFQKIHPDDVPWTRHALQKLLQNPGYIASGAFRVLHKDGSWRWMGGVGTNLLAEPSVHAIVVNYRDITRRKQAQDAIRQNHSLLHGITEGTTDLVFAKDIEGRYQMVNTAGARWLGLTVEQILGRTAIDLFAPDTAREVMRRDRAVLAAGEAQTYEITATTKAGVTRVHLTTKAPYRDATGKAIGIVGIARDITDRKQTEMARDRLARQLDTLLDVARTVTSALELGPLLHQLLERAMRALPAAATGAIHLYDAQTGLLMPEVCFGVDRQVFEQMTFRAGDSMFAVVFQMGKALLIQEPGVGAAQLEPLSAEQQRLLPAALNGRAIRSAMGVPLRARKSEVVGALSLASTDARFTPEDLELLEAIAAQAAVAIDNARLFEALTAGRERLQSLSRQLLSAQEDERRAVARELHDEIGQILTAVQINLQFLRRHSDATAFQSLLEESLQITETAIHQVQDLSLSLRPSALDDLGLVAALRGYLRRQAERTGLSTRFTADPPDIDLPPDVRIACFRIAQESVTNAVRHAGAKEVAVDLRLRKNEMELLVRDDGVGFNAETVWQAAASITSLGLLGMRERALLAGGRLEIHSSPGSGTEVRAWFPVPAPVDGGPEGGDGA